jgi:hypothetical protein
MSVYAALRDALALSMTQPVSVQPGLARCRSNDSVKWGLNNRKLGHA